jgi:hypothetical protein
VIELRAVIQDETQARRNSELPWLQNSEAGSGQYLAYLGIGLIQ